ncbi:MAG: T9SS type A sorting domain-containing protein, partial [Bacteroidota bacterium]
ITGSYDGKTGILSLSGTAALSAYETVLRSVTYQNTDAIDASAASRTIRFIVNDGTDNSNLQDRNIDISTSLNATPAALPFCESFETDGEGSRYGSNTFQNGCDFAIRDNAGTDANGCFAEIITGADGSWVFNTEDVDANGGFSLTSQALDISTLGLADLQLELLLAVSRDDEARWELLDQFRVEYSIDEGPYQILGLFRGNNPDTILGGNLFEDIDQDPATFGPFSAQSVADTFTNYVFNFQGQGSVMNYRIVINSTGTEELSFDNICVSGTSLCTNDTTQLTATSCDSSEVGVSEVVIARPSGCDSIVVTTTTLDLPPDAGRDTSLSILRGDPLNLNDLVSTPGGSFSIDGMPIGNEFLSDTLNLQGDSTIFVSYVVESGNTCPNDTATIEILVLFGGHSIDRELIASRKGFFKLFPNPSNHLVFIEMRDPLPYELEIDILNLVGQEIMTHKIKAGNTLQEIDIGKLEAGFYFIRLREEGKASALLRLMKEK